MVFYIYIYITVLKWIYVGQVDITFHKILYNWNNLETLFWILKILNKFFYRLS